MKITASRKDDILKRKAQYEAELAEYEAAEAEDHRRLNEAEDAIIAPIEEFLESELSNYPALHFDVRVERGYRSQNQGGVQVRILCNQHMHFNDDIALAWEYSVSLDADGNVQKESSSWSGLSAVTAEQMESLKQTVAALEWLNSIDWKSIIDVKMPKYKDYFDPNRKRPEREDFESQLQEAELEEYIGTNTFIKCQNWGESCPYRGDVWIQLLRETPSQYECRIISDWVFRDRSDLGDVVELGYVQRVRKTSVKPVTPMETVEV